MVKDSRNSSKPPSGDSFAKPAKSLRGKSKRNSGGQKGHPGSTLAWSDTINAVVTHPVTHCQECGASLAEVAAIEYELSQVHELPPLALQVMAEGRPEVILLLFKGCAQILKHYPTLEMEYPVNHPSEQEL